MRFLTQILDKLNRKPERSRPLAQDGAAYSCVLDQDPVLTAQCYIWLNCLLDIQGVPPERVFVHHTAPGNADFGAWVKSRGVNLVEIKPYDPRSPHCNKIRQLETFLRSAFSRVILMDCDTAWVGDAPLPSVGPVAGKIVDYANPPEPALAAFFREAGLGEPDWVPVSFPKEDGLQRTDRNNCNGGLYVLAGSVIPQLDSAWRKWADWSLKRRKLLGEFAIHVDQLSFALALRELGLSADLLPIEWNYPIHLPAAQLPDVTPQIIHFHRQLGSGMKFTPIGIARPDQVLESLNKSIECFLAKYFVNSVFWDYRYHTDPSLGSGVGSRGDFLNAKRQWLAYALGAFEDKAVVDVGCGDLEVARPLAVKNYTGLDVSEQALALARAKRPDWNFAHITGGESDLPEGDAVVCLDVLIHQKSPKEFEMLLRRLMKAARHRLIVSGYDGTPQAASAITAFHRPLAAFLKKSGLFSEISVIGNYRDCNLIVADKRPAAGTAHPNDMAADEFNEASLLTDRPDLLRHLADLSRATFGFYTRHFTRTLEYPWVAAKLETLAPGRRVLDIGSGLNPVPLFLARRGAMVDCVDPHPLRRVPPHQPDWNEWGYYDYAHAHPHLRSHNLDALSFEPKEPLDVVYSVSVIEHLPRTAREAMLARCRQWLGPGGRLLLTIDLIPGTQNLWNFSEGREVEPPSVHGNVTDFVNHLRSLGFTPSEVRTRQRIPHSNTDLLFVDCLA